jgi:hypothetical protein
MHVGLDVHGIVRLRIIGHHKELSNVNGKGHGAFNHTKSTGVRRGIPSNGLWGKGMFAGRIASGLFLAARPESWGTL